MYDIVKDVIESKNYELTDMLRKIDVFWLQGDLTDEQRTEMIELARTNAVPEHSYDIQRQLETLFANVAEVSSAVFALTDRVTVLEGGTVTPPEVDEYPPFKQPTGAHDAYNTGNKMTYTDGKRYICKMDGCVWGPDVYPDAWELAEE